MTFTNPTAEQREEAREIVGKLSDMDMFLLFLEAMYRCLLANREALKPFALGNATVIGLMEHTTACMDACATMRNRFAETMKGSNEGQT